MIKSETLFLSPSVRFIKEGARPQLPDSWPSSTSCEKIVDLVERAQAFLQLGIERGFEHEARQILSITGDGFRRPSTLENIRILANDPDRELKERFLLAMRQLEHDFNGRVPCIAWEALASLGLRPNPTKEVTIFSQREHLQHPWWLIDAVLHSISKVYGLFLHLQTRINETTGLALEHNCDCNHAIRTFPGTLLIRAELPKERHKEATAAFLTHFLLECYFIGVLGLPTAMGLSPEGRELRMELERRVA